MKTEITIYRGQYEHIEGSVPEFLGSHHGFWYAMLVPLQLGHLNTQMRKYRLGLGMFITCLFQIYSFPTYLCTLGIIQHSQQLCEEWLHSQ